MKKNKEEVCKNLKPLIEKILNLSTQIVTMRKMQDNHNNLIQNRKFTNNINQNNDTPSIVLLKKNILCFKEFQKL